MRVNTLPWPLLRVLGLVMPQMASLCEMRYLWRTPHALVNTRMAALTGAEPHTPFAEALRAALGELGLLESRQASAALPRTVMESFKVLRIGPREIAEHRDGLTINTPMVRVLTALGLFDRSKAPGPDDAATTGQIKDFNTKITATPAFFWMVTEGNERRAQRNAGRAYARAQLAATAYGLSMQPLSQALQEYPEQARPYVDIHALLQAPPPRYTVQMWARLGYAPPVGPSPRRGLEAHLIKA